MNLSHGTTNLFTKDDVVIRIEVRIYYAMKKTNHFEYDSKLMIYTPQGIHGIVYRLPNPQWRI